MDKLHDCVTTLVSTTDSEDKNFDVEFACWEKMGLERTLDRKSVV